MAFDWKAAVNDFVSVLGTGIGAGAAKPLDKSMEKNITYAALLAAGLIGFFFLLKRRRK
jgi:hypothetical protein